MGRTCNGFISVPAVDNDILDGAKHVVVGVVVFVDEKRFPLAIKTPGDGIRDRHQQAFVLANDGRNTVECSRRLPAHTCALPAASPAYATGCTLRRPACAMCKMHFPSLEINPAPDIPNGKSGVLYKLNAGIIGAVRRNAELTKADAAVGILILVRPGMRPDS